MSRSKVELPSEKEARLKSLNVKDDGEYDKKILAMNDELKRSMSMRGTLGLPELLDRRRIEHGIPDGAFKFEAVFNKVYIAPIAQELSDTYEGTSILKTDRRKSIERQETPQGIITSAGLRALDVLRSNGMDLGHLVLFRLLSPCRITMSRIGGVEWWLIPIEVGDIIGSEDIRSGMRAETKKIIFDVEEKIHVFEGQKSTPVEPWSREDY